MANYMQGHSFRFRAPMQNIVMGPPPQQNQRAQSQTLLLIIRIIRLKLELKFDDFTVTSMSEY